MPDDKLDDLKPSRVEVALRALDDARAARLEQELRLALLFERDPDRAAEIASWLP
jgi:hypothetical protein